MAGGFAPSFCYVCGAILGTPERRAEHMAAEHPGAAISWRARRPWVVIAGSPDVQVRNSDIKRWRKAAQASDLPRQDQHPRTGPARRRFSSIPGGAGPSTFPSSVPPADLDDASTAPLRPVIVQPRVQLSGAAMAEQTRETVREALTERVLAELVRELSVALSDADGAGPEGHLNAIQAAQIAHLLYDSTVDLIVDRFRGNVTRFKLSAAILLIVIAKGRVHVRAIASRVNERRLGYGPPAPELDDAEADGDPAADWQAAALAEEVAAPADPFVELRERQARWHDRAQSAASG